MPSRWTGSNEPSYSVYRGAAPTRRCLASQGHEDDDPVFFFSTRHLRRTWEYVREKAGIPHVRLNDLKHACAASMARSGMQLRELQKRLGHATITMTQRYAVYSPPAASIHYDAAIRRMGMGGEVPALVPVVEAEKKAAPEPEGPEAASRQGGGGGIRGQGAVRRLGTEHTRTVRAGVKNPQARYDADSLC